MNHRLAASAMIGWGLVVVGSLAYPVFAQGPQSKELAQAGARERDDSDASVKKIDQAIQSYESRTESDLDQIKKEVERLQKSLVELVGVRHEMAVSLAELRAEESAENGRSNEEGGRNVAASKPSESDQQHRRATELSREYRQLQEGLRAEIQRVRTETDQSVAQLRGIRTQRQQRKEQLKAAQERARINQQQSESKPQTTAAKRAVSND